MLRQLPGEMDVKTFLIFYWYYLGAGREIEDSGFIPLGAVDSVSVTIPQKISVQRTQEAGRILLLKYMCD